MSKVLNTKFIRAALAEFVGLTTYQSNDAAHHGSWYGTKSVKHLIRWEDWKPDESIEQMVMVEKALLLKGFEIKYGEKIAGIIRSSYSVSDLRFNDNSLHRSLAFAAALTAKERASAACEVLQEKWQEQD